MIFGQRTFKTLRTGVLILTTVFSAQLFAESGAIIQHMKDATTLNRERAPRYAALSEGKSLPLSYELILMENLAQLITQSLDDKARIYNAEGIGLFFDDLIDMRFTPLFQKTFGQEGPPVTRITIDVKSLRRRWIKMHKENKQTKIYEEALTLLDEGDLQATNQNCLTRHFVESIARSILNRKWHQDRAATAKLSDPAPILNSFLSIQINSLSWAYSLDRRAYSIQKENIPLFCQDVPAIPYK